MMEMGGLNWLADNWIVILNATGVVGELFFTAVSIRAETRTRRIANLLTITANHRDIWSELYDRPGLARVLDPFVNVIKRPVRQDEEIFVIFIILHVYSVYQAMKDGLFVRLEGLSKDIGWLFSLPIPKAIWEKMKALQNEDFVRFVEECRERNLIASSEAESSSISKRDNASA